MNQLDWNIGSNEPDTEQLEIQRQKDYEQDVAFLVAFSTPNGKKVMDWLQLHVLDAPTWWPSQPSEYGYFREGQNSLVRQIKDKIKRAKQYQEIKK